MRAPDPWLVIGAGTAASVAWFGLLAFTPLGYSDAADAPAAAARVAPQVAVVRSGREWRPTFGLSGRF